MIFSASATYAERFRPAYRLTFPFNLCQAGLQGARFNGNRSARKVLEDEDNAGGRNRTDTGLPPPDFESGASTSSTTPAYYFLTSYEGGPSTRSEIVEESVGGGKTF